METTRRLQKIRSCPPHMIDPMLGFHAPKVESAYLIPFADPRGGWFDHVKLKVFPDDTRDMSGAQVEEHRARWRYNDGARKYLVRRHAIPRLFFPIATLPSVLHGLDPLWIAEGPKKGLALAQLDVPVVAIDSAWGWHLKGSRDLIADFDNITLWGRAVKVCPDPDAYTDPHIGRAIHGLAEALERRGARVQLVKLPVEAAA